MNDLLGLLTQPSEVGSAADISAVQLVGPQTSKEEFRTCTTKCVSSGGYQGPHCGGWNEWRNWPPR